MIGYVLGAVLSCLLGIAIALGWKGFLGRAVWKHTRDVETEFKPLAMLSALLFAASLAATATCAGFALGGTGLHWAVAALVCIAVGLLPLAVAVLVPESGDAEDWAREEGERRRKEAAEAGRARREGRKTDEEEESEDGQGEAD